jgi:hypothetical protein
VGATLQRAVVPVLYVRSGNAQGEETRVTRGSPVWGSGTRPAWAFVRPALDDMSVMVESESEGELEYAWLDTGGRHRGSVTLRGLDHPVPPSVQASVISTGRREA